MIVAKTASVFRQKCRQALHDLAAARAAGRVIPGLDEIRHDIKRAIATQRLAWLRRALASYVVRKCRET